MTLAHFVEAQASSYRTALGELRAGKKRTHWMWFIFPQMRGLGLSPTAHYYGIASIEEARAYLSHPVLGSRYIECVEALQGLAEHDPVVVMGSVDAMKLRSSLTLFEAADRIPMIGAALDRWFSGDRDPATIEILRA
ncbi:DUF1810 domain-containing protein [Sphingobium cupriresistens]|uniref:DUF1810 domain-containing protein n=1 Tax=Sphingobium cupriresistens TaxID=1132417 RepID=UPI003BADDBED